MAEKKKKFRINKRTIMRDLIKHYAETLGEKVFMTFIRDFDKGLDEKYSYKDMHVYSNRLANGLLKLGIKKGDGIALFELNSPEYLFTVFASYKLGTFTVLVNTGLRGDGLKYILEHSDATSTIIHWSLLDRVMDIREQLLQINNIVVDINEAPEDFKLPEGTISLQEVMQASDEDIEVEISLDDLCMLMYTAGTTGLPKAIMFWQGRLLTGNSLQTLSTFAKALFQDDDVVFTSLPLFHSNALFLSTHMSYFNNNPLILGKRFSASRHWDICRKYDVTLFNTLGAMVTFLMKQPERSNDKEHKIRLVNTAACPKELWVAFQERFGVKIAESYAATDGGGFMITTGGAENVPVGSIGKPLGGAIGEVMDDDGNILKEPGKIGELVFLVRENEKASRKVGYYKDEKAAESLIQEGADGQLWFHSGDLVHKDKDGWFFFEDRKKDSIRRRGENIASYSIENIINQHEKTLEVAAYGIKTEEGEDEVMVAVVLKPGESLTPEELLDFCKGKMADFMIPRYIRFMDDLPKSKVHRVLKRELKKVGITEDTYDKEK
jgi:crotonobetaine/carnitine-CoA ligase